MDIKNVVPARDIVVIQLVKLDHALEELMTPNTSTEEEIAVRYGRVLSIGPDVDSILHCKDLKVGEIALFTEFAGHYITSDDKNLYKVIRGYDIIGKMDKEYDIINEKNLAPTGDRVLVEEIDTTIDSSGLIINESDPTKADLLYGKVVSVSELANTLGLVKDQVVAYPPYVGTVVRHYESDKLKTLKVIVENDILFTI